MPQIKHIVLLRFKADTSASLLEEIFGDLQAVVDKLPGVLDFTHGPNCSEEGLSRGFTHGFVMTFADDAARDTYLPDPDHEAVKQKILKALEGGLDGVQVFDYYG